MRRPASRRARLGVLSVERIGSAILQIYREPIMVWTVAKLAASLSMSRSAFSPRFTELVCEPTMQYLARWRMHLAGSWLLVSNITAAECAAKFGYNAEAAFNLAFKRVSGKPPGAWQALDPRGGRLTDI